MSAQMDFNKYNRGLAIEDYINGEIETMTPNDTAIFNMCLTNGTMGRSDQIKLRSMYQGLFNAVQDFLSKSNHGRVFIYEEEDKPKVVNIFIHRDAKDNNGTYSYRAGAKKSLAGYIRSGKIPSHSFVYIDHDSKKHSKMIEESLRYYLRWEYRFTALREELPECRQEETDF